MNIYELQRLLDSRNRQTKPTPRTRILQATGRVEDPKPVRSAAEILAGQVAFEKFRQLKGEL